MSFYRIQDITAQGEITASGDTAPTIRSGSPIYFSGNLNRKVGVVSRAVGKSITAKITDPAVLKLANSGVLTGLDFNGGILSIIDMRKAAVAQLRKAIKDYAYPQEYWAIEHAHQLVTATGRAGTAHQPKFETAKSHQPKYILRKERN